MQHMYGAAAVLLLLVAACTRPGNEAGASAAEPSPWTASGNEPGWRLALDGEQMTLTWNYGQDEAVMPRSENWKLSGEGLTVDKAQATLMACSRALDNQEREFLRLLATVQRFNITDDGALLLHSADGATITARRE